MTALTLWLVAVVAWWALYATAVRYFLDARQAAVVGRFITVLVMTVPVAVFLDSEPVLAGSCALSIVVGFAPLIRRRKSSPVLPPIDTEAPVEVPTATAATTGGLDLSAVANAAKTAVQKKGLLT